MESTMSAVPNQPDLENFIEFLFGGLQGYAYLAAQTPGDKSDWKQEFFNYPEQADELARVIRAASKSLEIYLAPALYSAKDATRENVKVSQVVWTEFDGNAPDWSDSKAGEPSLIVQSSSEANQHVYWRLDTPITNIDRLEDINRRITYNLSADSSAWDATQVLRPPESYNHKRGTGVQLRVLREVRYDLALFDSLAPAPEQISTDGWEVSALPDVQDVILRYSFSEDLVQLLKKDKHEVKDRSASLMNLAYGACQMGLKDNEVFVLLMLADDRWEKFKNRKDREKRLAHIITVARNKYPDSTTDGDDQFALAFGYQSFLDTEIEIDWAIEPMLMDAGSMLLVGPPGIGKTQLSLQFMIHLALGKDFLHYKIPKAKKVAFLSLEMGHGELKVFLERMNKDLTDPERLLLESNFIIVPHGESWALNTEVGQSLLINFIEQIEPYALFIDSIGSSIMGNISSDETIQPLLNFVDRIRKKYGMAVWFMHHTRKHQQGSNTPVGQDDVYGNQYLVARATSVYGVLPGKNGTIKMRNFKLRLAAKEQDYLIQRTDNLNFNKVNQVVDEHITKTTIKETGNEPTAPGGFAL